MHHRRSPRIHKFSYTVFMFGLDLDELDTVAHKLRLVGRNRFNLYQFNDGDHLAMGQADVRANIEAYLREQGLTAPIGRIFLVTNLRFLGYVFNPVSFYYCYTPKGEPLAVVAEVHNTYRECKPFFLGPDTNRGGHFATSRDKHFYISPFAELDNTFTFRLAPPGERLTVAIHSERQGARFFTSTLAGERRPLTDGQLLRATARFPFITLGIIGAIHWQALKLYLKGVPHFRKSDRADLQRGIYGRRAASSR